MGLPALSGLNPLSDAEAAGEGRGGTGEGAGVAVVTVTEHPRAYRGRRLLLASW